MLFSILQGSNIYVGMLLTRCLDMLKLMTDYMDAMSAPENTIVFVLGKNWMKKDMKLPEQSIGTAITSYMISLS